MPDNKLQSEGSATITPKEMYEDLVDVRQRVQKLEDGAAALNNTLREIVNQISSIIARMDRQNQLDNDSGCAFGRVNRAKIESVMTSADTMEKILFALLGIGLAQAATMAWYIITHIAGGTP